MERDVTALEARAALDTVERGRQRIIDEIDLPTWYWAGLALGWVGIGVISDLGHGWLSAAATLAFGAVHAAIAPRVLSGRRRSRSLTVRRDVAGPHAPRWVFGGLIVLVALTIAGALAADADGARHPATVSSVLVAVILVLGGPRLLGAVRRSAARAGAGR